MKAEMQRMKEQSIQNYTATTKDTSPQKSAKQQQQEVSHDQEKPKPNAVGGLEDIDDEQFASFEVKQPSDHE